MTSNRPPRPFRKAPPKPEFTEEVDSRERPKLYAVKKIQSSEGTFLPGEEIPPTVPMAVLRVWIATKRIEER